METARFQKLDLWAERLVSFPGCDQKTLNIRKTIWIATVFGLVHVILHTGAFLIFAPQSLHLLINYGYKLLIIIGFTLFVAPKLIRGFNLYFVSYLTDSYPITWWGKTSLADWTYIGEVTMFSGTGKFEVMTGTVQMVGAVDMVAGANCWKGDGFMEFAK
jgi:hypothetical protein